MKKNTTTALTLPTASIQPKPTKTEIVEAMLTRAKVKHDAENERRKVKSESLRKKIEALALKLAKSMTPTVAVYAYNDTKASHCDVRIDRIKSPELDGMLDEYKAHELVYWDESEMRKSIRRELSGVNRPTPTALLENPEVVKAIDAMLTRWGI